MWDPHSNENTKDTKIKIIEVILPKINAITQLFREEFGYFLKISLVSLILWFGYKPQITLISQFPIINQWLPKIWMIFIIIIGIQIFIMEAVIMLTSVLIIPANEYFQTWNFGQIKYLFWEYFWVLFSSMVVSITISIVIGHIDPLAITAIVMVMGTLSYLIEILDQIIPYPPLLVLEIEEEEIV